MKTNHHLLNLYKLMSTSQLFENVHEQHLQHIIHHAHRIRFNKNEYIHISTDQKDYCYLIEKGNISLSRVTHDGNTHVIDIVTTGSLFGIINLFAEKLESQMLAEAIETSFLWRIPIYILRELMEKDTLFTRNILRMNLKTRVVQDNELEHRSVQNAAQRLCCFLLHQLGDIDESPVVVELPYNKKHIAAKLSIRSETFSRVLKVIDKETGTKITGSTLIIKDIDRLKSYTCQSCSLQYPCNNHDSNDMIY